MKRRTEATPENAEALAKMVGEIAASLPEDMSLVIFLIADLGGSYQSALAATTTPNVFAPVLRDWLERYDAGDAP